MTEEQIRANQGKLEEQGKTEISLTLTSKFEQFEDDDTDMKALFVRTKRLVVDVLRTQTGDNLNAILYTPATDEEVSLCCNRTLELAPLGYAILFLSAGCNVQPVTKRCSFSCVCIV